MKKTAILIVIALLMGVISIANSGEIKKVKVGEIIYKGDGALLFRLGAVADIRKTIIVVERGIHPVITFSVQINEVTDRAYFMGGVYIKVIEVDVPNGTATLEVATNK